MRTILVALMLSAAVTTAHARDYPWCLYGGELGPSGDCSYQTREQCQASAFGMSRLYCDVNRRYRFEQRGAQPKRVPRY
jgi:hypothetical protein